MTLRSIAKDLARRLTPPSLKMPLVRAALATLREDERDAASVHYNMASMEWSLRHLRRAGFRPRLVVDVGAYQGGFTTEAKAAFPEARVLMIEAQASKRAILEQIASRYGGTVHYRQALLGAEAREAVPFFELETGSSMLEEQSTVPRAVATYPMRPLDAVIAEAGLGSADLLKLDVQGYELEVLRGGAATLAAAEVVIMEVSLIAINRGAPLITDVLTFMQDRGFRPYDISSLMRRPLDEALFQIDMIFVRGTSALVSSDRFDGA